MNLPEPTRQDIWLTTDERRHDSEEAAKAHEANLVLKVHVRDFAALLYAALPERIREDVKYPVLERTVYDLMTEGQSVAGDDDDVVKYTPEDVRLLLVALDKATALYHTNNPDVA